MTKIRAAAHVRVSTSSQIDGESLNTQRLQIQDYCTSRGWELVKVYIDAGISGTKNDRPALYALLLAAKSAEIDAVVVRDLAACLQRDLPRGVHRRSNIKYRISAFRFRVEAGFLIRIIVE
jgi:DNA invertase Pin-like site-specific DNA recombinase